MIFSVISILVSVCFCIVVMKGSQIEPAYKTKKIASVIYNVLLISPIIATITFFILFSTVLKGRLIERSSHALIVFVLWVYGTAFYVNILKFFNLNYSWRYKSHKIRHSYHYNHSRHLTRSQDSLKMGRLLL